MDAVLVSKDKTLAYMDTVLASKDTVFDLLLSLNLGRS